MSGFQAYTSFYEFLKSQLVGICAVLVQGDQKPDSGAYLYLEDGPEEAVGKWVSVRLCQARLFVKGLATQPVSITGGKKLDQVLDAIRDKGTLDKYDYKDDGTSLKTGLLNYNIESTSGDISQDPEVYQAIISFELQTNSEPR